MHGWVRHTLQLQIMIISTYMRAYFIIISTYMRAYFILKKVNGKGQRMADVGLYKLQI